jgi:hypothetical protein
MTVPFFRKVSFARKDSGTEKQWFPPSYFPFVSFTPFIAPKNERTEEMEYRQLYKKKAITLAGPLCISTPK